MQREALGDLSATVSKPNIAVWRGVGNGISAVPAPGDLSGALLGRPLQDRYKAASGLRLRWALDVSITNGHQPKPAFRKSAVNESESCPAPGRAGPRSEISARPRCHLRAACRLAAVGIRNARFPRNGDRKL